MKKIFPATIILLFMVMCFSGSALSQTITVSGAGSNIVDGNYPKSIYTPGGKNSYMRGDGYTIMWESDRWILINENGSLRYYYNTNNTILPPAIDWQVGVDGIAPTPTMGGDVDPMPVELTSFIGTVKGTCVELAWKTATETNNYGFEVERSAVGQTFLFDHSNGQSGMIVPQWEKIGFIEGHGTTNAPQSYSFVDGNASGAVAYRLKQIDRDGSFEYSNQVEVTVAAPVEFALMQNHPNPFNPATSISYTLPVAGQVSLKIYDMLGKEIATLVNGMQDAGAKIANFDASQLPSGIYFYSLRANNFTATKKMLLIK